MKKSSLKKFDPLKIRVDFPILKQKINGNPLIYFDNAATSQKPKAVIESVQEYYSTQNANIHRGVYSLAEQVNELYEATRIEVAKFFNAKSAAEIVFVRNATEAINLVAESFARDLVNAGDEILVSIMEHHSNFLPWQRIAHEKKAHLKIIPINDRGEIELEKFRQLISAKTKIIALTHASNVLGTVNPIQEMIALAKKHNIPILIDGAQAVPHLKVDLQKLAADFYVFSAHKMFGPTGVGILYGKEEILKKMKPYQVGGGMIQQVTIEKTIFSDPPQRFEAGTPDIAGIIGFKKTLEYLSQIDLEKSFHYEQELLNYANDKLKAIPGIRLFGTAREKVAVISLLLDNIHPHDLGTVLDTKGIAIRAGHHCAMPLMENLGISATARVSFAFYNTFAEIDVLLQAILEAKKFFKK